MASLLEASLPHCLDAPSSTVKKRQIVGGSFTTKMFELFLS
jgi:hypothetical protein